MHDLRHSFAYNYLLKGGEMYQLQAILGHKSIKMTVDLYGQLNAHGRYMERLFIETTVFQKTLDNLKLKELEKVIKVKVEELNNEWDKSN